MTTRRDVLAGLASAGVGAAIIGPSASAAEVKRPKLTTPTYHVRIETHGLNVAMRWHLYDVHTGEDIGKRIPAAHEPTVNKVARARVGDSFYCRRFKMDEKGKHMSNGYSLLKERIHIIVDEKVVGERHCICGAIGIEKGRPHNRRGSNEKCWRD